MKKGPIITAVIAVLAMAAVVAAFVSNASPYVTIAQARTIHSDHLNLAGDMVKNSARMDFSTHTLKFQLKDASGAMITVFHRGDPPENMAEVSKVVAIGGMEGDHFVSEKLLIKCPSKYDATKTASLIK